MFLGISYHTNKNNLKTNEPNQYNVIHEATYLHYPPNEAICQSSHFHIIIFCLGTPKQKGPISTGFSEKHFKIYLF